MLDKLERFGGQAGLGQADAATKNAGDAQPKISRPGQKGFDFLTVKRQITQQCLASAQKCWQEKDIAEAEMAYVGSQLVAHQHMLDSMMVFRQYASPKLGQLIDDGTKTVQQHKEHAEKLIEELGHEAHSRSSAKK